ncbi:MAG: lysozyme inhibitor LprI family protein [Pseudomonadota bacterium]
MRLALFAASALAVCAQAAAQTSELRAGQLLFGGVESDHALIAACLRAEERSCENVVQDTCWADAEARHEELTGVFARACDERAIAAWEGEMNAALTALRGKLSGHDLDDLEASQRAWRRSVLADAQLAVDSFQGGTGAGRAADEVQAHATARRALFLMQLSESYP